MRAHVAVLVACLILAGCTGKEPAGTSSPTEPLASSEPDAASSSGSSSSPAASPTVPSSSSSSSSSSSPSSTTTSAPEPVAPSTTHDVAVDIDDSIGPFACVMAQGRTVCTNQLPGSQRAPLLPRGPGAAINRFNASGLLDSGHLTLTWEPSSELTNVLEIRVSAVRGCDPRCEAIPEIATFSVNGTSPLDTDVPALVGMEPTDLVQITVRTMPSANGFARGSTGQDFHLEGVLTYTA